MSKLQELIRELCPEGVEFKKLGEVGTFTRGNGLQKRNFTESGVGCIHYGQIYTYYGFYTYKTKSFVDKELSMKLTKVHKGDLIIACTSENIEDVCKAVAWLGDNEIVTGGHACVFAHNENSKYISYFFQTDIFFQQKKKYVRGTKVIDIKVSDLEKIEIPLPPLEVQNEIVRILDAFTSHAAELHAELQARKEQYEYYRNKLLSFPRGAVLELKIGEIYEFKYGVGNKIPTNPGEYPVYGSNGIVGSYNMYNNEDGPVIGHIGAYAGIVNWAKGKHFVTYNGVICKCVNKMVNHRYGYYLLLLQNYTSKAKTGSQPFISYDILEEPVVKIPSLSEQQRIVSILDKFESLVNDLSEGLPAEIAAVQEQYEYYRNKLLKFSRMEKH